MFEIERKYILKTSFIVDLLKIDGMVIDEKEIIQAYIKIKSNYEIRVRKIGNNYLKTKKIGQGLVREEFENEITQEEFEENINSCIGNLIEKKRFSFKMYNLPCSIDVYKNNLEGLIILEVEFPCEDSANSFVMPSILQENIKLEVTKDKRYKNYFLALFGQPKNIQRDIFENILKTNQDTEFNDELLEALPINLSTFEGMRLVFYNLLKKINQLRLGFIETSCVQKLHQFRTNLRKTRSLLQTVDGIFDEKITKRFIDELKFLASFTNSKRDLDVFVEYLETSDDEEAELLLGESFIIQNNECHKVKEFFKNEKVDIILQEWAVVLEDNNGFYEGNSSKNHLKFSIAIAIRLVIKKISKDLKKLNEASPLKNFHSIRIEFKKLRYLLEFFSKLFHESELNDCLISSKKMQDYFGLLQDRDVQKKFLINLEKNENIMMDIEKIYAIEVLLQSIKNEIYFYKTKILNKKSKLISQLEKTAKNLKPYIVTW